MPFDEHLSCFNYLHILKYIYIAIPEKNITRHANRAIQPSTSIKKPAEYKVSTEYSAHFLFLRFMIDDDLMKTDFQMRLSIRYLHLSVCIFAENVVFLFIFLIHRLAIRQTSSCQAVCKFKPFRAPPKTVKIGPALEQEFSGTHMHM